MDFDPTEIRRMMEKRQRELRANRLSPEHAVSLSKRSRQEEENETDSSISLQKQENRMGHDDSPKSPRRDTASTPAQATNSTRARLNEISKRFAEFEDHLPRRSPASETPNAPRRSERVQKAPTLEKLDESEQASKAPSSPTLSESKVPQRGKIADRISKFEVGKSVPRCEIDTKPMASVSARAKFFEKAMETNKRAAADTVNASPSERTTKFNDEDERALSEEAPQVPGWNPIPEEISDEPCEPLEKVAELLHGEVAEEGHSPETRLETVPEPSKQEQREPKKIGTVSSKLRTHLQDLMLGGHRTLDDTLMSISEKDEEHTLHKIDEGVDGKLSNGQSDGEVVMSPPIVEKSQGMPGDEENSTTTAIAEDGHSSPKPCVSSCSNIRTPEAEILASTRGDAGKETPQREEDEPSAVLRSSSDPPQAMCLGKKKADDEESTLECYKREIEEQVTRQESFMKQFSHALQVCQERGDKGSKEHVEAERFLLIASERHHLAATELQRIDAQKSLPQTRGTLAISEIKLPFKNEFLKLLRQCNNTLEKTHYFLVLVRSGATLVHTGLFSSNDEIFEGSVCFNDSPGLSVDLQKDFKVFVEVYAVQASNPDHPECKAVMDKIRREKEKESKKGGGILSVLTPSKRKKAQGTSQVAEVKIRKPSFGLIGRVALDENLIAQNERWHRLDDFYEESPLDGRIHMKLLSETPEKVHHCGTVRLNDGFITSYFAAIEGSRLNLYKDIRSAEESQEPIRYFELSEAVDIVRMERIIDFYYFTLKLSAGRELRFLTYSQDDSNEWARKLNARITTYLKELSTQ